MAFAKHPRLSRRLAVILAVSIFFILLPNRAPAAFNLLETYQLARENDPVYRKAVHQNRAGLEVKNQALARFYPALNAEGQYKKTEEEIVSSDNTYYTDGESDYPTTSYSVALTQPLFNYTIWVGYKQAKAQVMLAELELEIARQELIMRSAEVYTEALSAKDNLVFAETELAAVSLNNISAEKRYSAGLVAVTDLYDSRARLSTSIAKRAAAEDVLDDALRALEEITGKLPAAFARLREGIPLVDPAPADEEQWVTQALAQNPVLLARTHAVAVASREVERQKSAHYPTVDLTYSFNNRDTEGSLFGGGSEVKTTEAMVTMKLPIFQGWYVSSKTTEARELLKAANEELSREKRGVERQVRSAYQGVLSSIERVRALEDALEAQLLTLQAKKKGFDAGLLTSLAVLDAERDLFFIKTDYATARYDYLINTLRLKRGAGILGEEDVVAVNLMLL